MTKKNPHHNILKKNKNELLLTNQEKFNVMLKIQKNEKKKKFLFIKKSFKYRIKKIDDMIKIYHNESLQKHSNVKFFLQLLR